MGRLPAMVSSEVGGLGGCPMTRRGRSAPSGAGTSEKREQEVRSDMGEPRSSLEYVSVGPNAQFRPKAV